MSVSVRGVWVLGVWVWVIRVAAVANKAGLTVVSERVSVRMCVCVCVCMYVLRP